MLTLRAGWELNDWGHRIFVTRVLFDGRQSDAPIVTVATHSELNGGNVSDDNIVAEHLRAIARQIQLKGQEG